MATATVELTEITPTGSTYAFAVWRMPDLSVQVVYLTQTQYDLFAGTKTGILHRILRWLYGLLWGLQEPMRRPGRGATFLLAVGGSPVFNTPTGRPRAGDFWVRDEVTRETTLFFSDDPDWSYSRTIADDPLDGETSQVSGFELGSARNSLIVMFTSKQLARLRVRRLNGMFGPLSIVNNAAVKILDGYIQNFAALIDETIPNHHSVTFDAKSSGTANGTSVTISHVMSSGANGYMAGLAAYNPSSALSTVKFNAIDLTSRVTQSSGGGNARKAEYWDLVAPASGTHNIVFTFAGSVFSVCGAISATGVDQTTPRSNTNTNSGLSTANPSLTLTSATGELAITYLANHSESPTVDATWTTGWNTTIITVTNGSSAYKAGASSVTRTDTMNADDWAFVGVSIKAAAAAGGIFLPQRRSNQAVNRASTY